MRLRVVLQRTLRILSVADGKHSLLGFIRFLCFDSGTTDILKIAILIVTHATLIT